MRASLLASSRTRICIRMCACASASTYALFRMPEPLDYNCRPALRINNIAVTRHTVIGVLTEQAPRIAQKKEISFGGFMAEDLPDRVALKLDGRGERFVKATFEDRRVALDVAQQLRMKMSSLGAELYKSCVEVRDNKGKKLGEHDMLVDVVGESARALRGYISVELKCRWLDSNPGLEKVRTAMRAECCDKCNWWLSERPKYAGRLPVLAHFYQEQSFRLHGDLRMNGESEWRSLFGWGRAVHGRWVLPPRAALVSSAKAKARPVPKAKAKAKASVELGPAVGRGRDILDGLSWTGGVASIKSLLVAVKKNKDQVHYWRTQAQRKYSWTAADLYQRPRDWESRPGNKRQRLGGKEEWVASRRVLEQMYLDWFGAGSL